MREASDPGGVHEHLGAAEVGCDRVHGGLHRRGVHHVDLVRPGPAAPLPDLGRRLLGGVGVEIDGGDRRTLVPEAMGGGAPEPRAGPGDDRDVIREARHVPPSWAG